MVLAVSCKKAAFVKTNINPSTLASVDPGAQFLFAASNFPNSFEAFYDYYRAIMPWMQMTTNSGGNPANFTNASSNFNYRYGQFYGTVGLALADIPHLIANMPAAEQTQRVDENAIASIAKAYYAFYVTDINGSIPYSQAFQARYGGTLTPTYDTQETLFDSLDLQIKNAVTTLEATSESTQTLYGGNDPFYGTASDQALAWEKAGNALRLKIALRLIKRNPTGLAAIAQSVLADANQMSAIGDSWMLPVGNAFAVSTGNFNPTGFLGARDVINFMNTTSDPREPIFYRLNLKNEYVGSPANPDTCASTFWKNLYTNDPDTFSAVQHRLFTPDFDEGDGNGPGGGTGFYPFLTYAEYCFIRADLAFQGITSDNAQTWYNNGVTASIQFYDARAQAAQVANYTAVTSAKIAAYLLQPGVAYNAAIGEQQITCQAFLDFYRQPSEAWAWWKRTGYPNTTTPIAWEPLTSGGTPNVLNRRAALTLLPTSDANYANQQAAITQMETDPGFGSSPSDAAGRVWWDMQ
jgi:Starch-binding associating with outer membrane